MTVRELMDILSKHGKGASGSLPVGITINDHFYEFSNISQEYINQENDITFFSIDAKRATKITKVLCFNKLIDNGKKKRKRPKRDPDPESGPESDPENNDLDDGSYVEF